MDFVDASLIGRVGGTDLMNLMDLMGLPGVIDDDCLKVRSFQSTTTIGTENTATFGQRNRNVQVPENKQPAYCPQQWLVTVTMITVMWLSQKNGESPLPLPPHTVMNR
jgi:hypothetical protein